MSENQKQFRGLWVKLYHAFLDDEKICAIEMLPNGFFHILAFVKLLILAHKLHRFGRIALTDYQPMTVPQIARRFRFDAHTFESSLNVLQEYELLFVDSDECLCISNYDRYQEVDLGERVKYETRLRQWRVRNKRVATDLSTGYPHNFQQTLFEHEIVPDGNLVSASCHKNVTEMSQKCHTNVTAIDKDIDKESSLLNFSEQEEKIIQEYVKCKEEAGEIDSTPESYTQGVIDKALADKKSFKGMISYIKKQNSKKVKSKQQDISVDLLEAEKFVREKYLELIHTLPKPERLKIRQMAEELASESVPVGKVPPEGLIEAKMIQALKDSLRDKLFKSLRDPNFTVEMSPLRHIDRFEFEIDLAEHSKKPIPEVRKFLKEKGIDAFDHYSLLLRDKESSRELIRSLYKHEVGE